MLGASAPGGAGQGVAHHDERNLREGGVGCGDVGAWGSSGADHDLDRALGVGARGDPASCDCYYRDVTWR